MTREEIRMSEPEVDRFLHAHRLLALSTNGPTGWPHLVNVNYGWWNGRVAFQGYTRSQKLANLRRDARLTCLVEETTEYGAIKGVQLRGHATLHDDHAAVLAVLKSVLEIRPDSDDSEVLAALTTRVSADIGARGRTATEAIESFTAKRCAVVVEPDRIVSWDHSKLNGRY
jgi:hypothetical protein